MGILFRKAAYVKMPDYCMPLSLRKCMGRMIVYVTNYTASRGWFEKFKSRIVIHSVTKHLYHFKQILRRQQKQSYLDSFLVLHESTSWYWKVTLDSTMIPKVLLKMNSLPKNNIFTSPIHSFCIPCAKKSPQKDKNKIKYLFILYISLLY